jgi:hypothetical protein
VSAHLEQLSILVQTAEVDRQIAVYTYDAPDHPEGYRTFTVLQVDDGIVTDQHGRRLSA